MARPCSVCSHPESHAINVALIQRDAYTSITSGYGVSAKALQRHVRDHLPRLLVKAKEAVEVAEAGDLLSRIEALQSRTLAILEATEDTEHHSVALAAIREARANLELIGRVTKELVEAPTVNLHLNPEWVELRAVIVGALEPYTAAKDAVIEALEGAEHAAH